MKQKTEHQKGTVENIYQLNGTVPIAKAIPFGLQHILAMFVANIAPILIVASACGLSRPEYSDADSKCHVDCRNRNARAAISDFS